MVRILVVAALLGGLPQEAFARKVPSDTPSSELDQGELRALV